MLSEMKKTQNMLRCVTLQWPSTVSMVTVWALCDGVMVVWYRCDRMIGDAGGESEAWASAGLCVHDVTNSPVVTSGLVLFQRSAVPGGRRRPVFSAPCQLLGESRSSYSLFHHGHRGMLTSLSAQDTNLYEIAEFPLFRLKRSRSIMSWQRHTAWRLPTSWRCYSNTAVACIMVICSLQYFEKFHQALGFFQRASDFQTVVGGLVCLIHWANAYLCADTGMQTANIVSSGILQSSAEWEPWEGREWGTNTGLPSGEYDGALAVFAKIAAEARGGKGEKIIYLK